jgi:hypothetical protein
VSLGFGTGRQRTVLERWIRPNLSRRTCTCEYKPCTGTIVSRETGPVRPISHPETPHVTIRDFCIAVTAGALGHHPLPAPPLPRSARGGGGGLQCAAPARAVHSAAPGDAVAPGGRRVCGRGAGRLAARARKRPTPYGIYSGPIETLLKLPVEFYIAGARHPAPARVRRGGLPVSAAG